MNRFDLQRKGFMAQVEGDELNLLIYGVSAEEGDEGEPLQLATADANKAGFVDCHTTKKYARVVHTPGGAGVASGIMGYASLLIYGYEALPVVNSPVAVIV